jgi:hypothetical protein
MTSFYLNETTCFVIKKEEEMMLFWRVLFIVFHLKTSGDNLFGEGIQVPFFLFSVIPMTKKACFP